MITLRAEMEVLSPLYLGGADQSAELRPPSLKGLLRFWYRALDPNFALHEARFFGGTAGSEGQAPFLLRVRTATPTIYKWERKQIEQRFTEGQGRAAKNGLIYLGFPFQMKGNENRSAVVPRHRFTLEFILHRGDPVPLRRALLGALWCLGHLGSAGTRSRRGFGSLTLRSWTVQPATWPELKQLPLLCERSTPAAWNDGLNQALDVFSAWFGDVSLFKDRGASHPHLGEAFITALLPENFAPDQWEQALNLAGRKLQDFRQRRAPDYQRVKDLVQGKRLDQAPERAAFGLPLAFRYGSLPGSRPVMFTPSKETGDRHGSLLFVRLAALKDRIHPLFVRMDGALPAVSPPATIGGQGRPLRPPSGAILDEFLESLTQPGRRS
jgi:CRISPR-associated protein Cmr1